MVRSGCLVGPSPVCKPSRGSGCFPSLVVRNDCMVSHPASSSSSFSSSLHCKKDAKDGSAPSFFSHGRFAVDYSNPVAVVGSCMLHNVHGRDAPDGIAAKSVPSCCHCLDHVVCFVVGIMGQATTRAPELLSLIAKRKWDLRLRKCRQMLALCGRGQCSDVEAVASTWRASTLP